MLVLGVGSISSVIECTANFGGFGGGTFGLLGTGLQTVSMFGYLMWDLLFLLNPLIFVRQK